MALQQAAFAFAGGIDVVSPALAVPPARLIAGMNYEPLAEGYGRVEGYERSDGRLAPSSINFWALDFDGGIVPISSGDIIQGLDSGATARVLLDPDLNAGTSWGASNAAGTLVLMPPTGTFIDNEIIRVGGTPCALSNGAAVEDSAATEDLRMAWRQEAQEYQRAFIEHVPGSGPVRGVAELKGTIYGWRDNEAATACLMYKQTVSGWALVPFGHLLTFTAGLVEIAEGSIITGNASSATAEVVRLNRQSGDWGVDATGYITVNILSGTFTPGEALKVGATPVATLGEATAISIAPGGRFHTLCHNFYGSAATYRMYGANGVDYGFEFDGTNYIPIKTGTARELDKPTRVGEIANSLLFGYVSGSIQGSALGEPLMWATVDGGWEVGLGTELTDLVQAAETAVVVFGTQKIGIISGTDTETFKLEELTEEAGADAWTAQRVGTTMYLDRRGLRSLASTQAFGNFKTGTLSALIEPYFRAKRKAGFVSVASFVCRAKSQYRLLWSDMTGLAVYMGRKTPEAIPFAFNNMQPFCAMTCELGDGTEGMFVGAEDGFVYRLDSGTSQDGYGIKGFVMTPFNHLGAARVDKRWHSVQVEMQAPPSARIGLTVQFDYGDGQNPLSGAQDFMVLGSGGIDFRVQGGGGSWSQVRWNEFYWSSPVQGSAASDIDGYGRSASLIIACDSALTEPSHVLQSYCFATSPRKAVVSR